MKRIDDPRVRARAGDAPPAALEERVVAALREADLILPQTTEEMNMRIVHMRWAVAAGVLLLVGLFAGSYGSRAAPEAPVADARPQFALLLYENEAYQAAATPDGQAARVAEYTRWARALAAEGRLVDAGKLADDGTYLGGADSRTAVVPRAPEGVLTGYFVIRASDREEAERIARESPHLKYGGAISLREIEA